MKKEDKCKACGSAKCEAYDWCQCCGKCRNCGQAHQPYTYPWWVTNIPQLAPVMPTVYPEITWTTTGTSIPVAGDTITCFGCQQ